MGPADPSEFDADGNQKSENMDIKATLNHTVVSIQKHEECRKLMPTMLCVLDNPER